MRTPVQPCLQATHKLLRDLRLGRVNGLIDCGATRGADQLERIYLCLQRNLFRLDKTLNQLRNFFSNTPVQRSDLLKNSHHLG